MYVKFLYIEIRVVLNEVSEAYFLRQVVLWYLESRLYSIIKSNHPFGLLISMNTLENFIIFSLNGVLWKLFWGTDLVKKQEALQ